VISKDVTVHVREKPRRFDDGLLDLDYIDPLDWVAGQGI
jgi:hypothetical protein